MMELQKVKFNVGQIINHKLFNYRGVVVDVDPAFQNTEEWYDLMAKTRPSKRQPWYHVLVDDTDYVTYVAEQNLILDKTHEPVTHPELMNYFQRLENGLYKLKQTKQ
jgi:heat shock protein HspQ